VTVYKELEKTRNELALKFKVAPIPSAQKEIIKEIPDLFKTKAFFKMHPRPNTHDLSREYSYYKYCLKHVKNDGLWAEFGVYQGVSCKYLSEIKYNLFPGSKERLQGFDSFEGLPEQWHNQGTGKGKFNVGGNIPKIANVDFHKGWFKDTIPKFLKNTNKPFAFIHVDCDIYSSTVDILNNLKNRIVPGTVILFDELIGYDAWDQHEYKAFMEFVEENNVEFEWLAFVANAGQAACKITKIGV
tara:strand:+ start:1482 stop:2210 length:729 start_codon:yes stop_codon:yes gene_type:complete